MELRSDDFEVHTWECLNRACKVLCSPAPAPISPDVSADANDPTQCISQSLAQSGWKLEAKSAYWVWLSHPKTGLQLDIKVGVVITKARTIPVEVAPGVAALWE